jgi:predicted O-methyltransferase YrrM
LRPPKFFRRYGYDTRRLPNAYLASLEEGVTTLEEARLRTGMTIGYPGWSLIYDLLTATLEPGEENPVVETGTNFGCTTIILAQALIDAGVHGAVTTIEIDPKIFERAQQNITAAGVAPRVKQVLGDAKMAIGDAVRELPFVRFAFLDGCHLHDDVVQEFAQVVDALAPGALVVFDNTYLISEPHEDQRVNGALKTIQARWGGNLINLPSVSWYTPGVAIWQKVPFPSTPA